MIEDIDGLFQITSDGTTVWVNSAAAMGSMVGRFGFAGIDIHRSPLEQQESGQECLFCTHHLSTAEDWTLFVAKMKELYGCTVPERHRPKRFRKLKATPAHAE